MGNIILFFLICFMACSAGSISGVGGGVMIKPLMDAVSGYSVEQISFLSSCTVLAMAVMSLLRSRKSEIRLDLKKGTSLALGAAVGGICGKQIFNFATASVSGPIVSMVQSIVLLLFCMVVFIYTLKKNNIQPRGVQNIFLCALIGICLGTMSAFLGIGGGPINVMAISYLMGTDSKTTALYSIYTILFSQVFGIGFMAVSGTIPQVNIFALLAMVLGGLTGAFIGLLFSKKMKNRHVDRLFLIILGVMGLILGYNILNNVMLLAGTFSMAAK